MVLGSERGEEAGGEDEEENEEGGAVRDVS